ncbi:MAG: S41 family peptidase [Roseivirga sp.]|nr:S41 family peptidase [Roseivirga sp.]
MKKHFIPFFFLLFLAAPVLAQESFDKKAIVNRLADIMNENYVFPEKGKAMHDLIKSKLGKGDYDDITSADAFAEQLDADLKSIIYDKHIRVRFNKERVTAMQNRAPGGGRTMPENFGFKEVKILEDNIGYLDLRGFMDMRVARKAAKVAMDELIEADAIIFDLRQNGGGSPSMIRFISAYIFGEEPVHLNDFYWRPSDSYSESWTRPSAASVHKPDIPVYVLTSDYTFSAAEEFTYNLKNLERATIIGETTGGGAHPGGPMVINDSFFVNVPQGRAINPITKTNWEGTGIEPHIKTTKEEALEKALELARKALTN